MSAMAESAVLDHGLPPDLVRAWVWAQLAPAPAASLWDWCVAHPVLPGGRRWDPARAGFMRRWYEVIDARLRRRPLAGHPTAHRANSVSLALAAQMYKTTLLTHVLAACLAHHPRKAALFMPRKKDLDAVRKAKLLPMLDAIPEIASLLPQGEQAREAALAADIWQVGLASLYYQQGCVADDYRREDYELVVADEIDRFPEDVEGEGDARELLHARGREHPTSFLMLDACSPTLAHRYSWRGFAGGSCERPIIELPCCGYAGDLDPECVVLAEGRAFADVAVDEIMLAHLGRYACPGCGTLLSDAQLRPAMRLAAQGPQRGWCPGEWRRDADAPLGIWIPHAPRDSVGRLTGPLPPPEGLALSGNANALYSSAVSLSKFAAGKARAEQGNRRAQKTWRNVECALPSIETTIVASVDAISITTAAPVPYQLGSLPLPVDLVVLIFDQQGNTRGRYWYPWVCRGVVRPRAPGELPRLYLLGEGYAMSESERDAVEDAVYPCGNARHQAHHVVMDSANGNAQADIYLWAAGNSGRRMLLRGDARTPDLWQRLDDGPTPTRRKRTPRPAGVSEYRVHPHRWRDRLWEAVQASAHRDVDWFLPTNPSQRYLRSLTSEEQATELRRLPGVGIVEEIVWRPRQMHGAHGDITHRQDNHLWDCEAMMLAACDILGITDPIEPAPPPVPHEPASNDWLGDLGGAW